MSGYRRSAERIFERDPMQRSRRTTRAPFGPDRKTGFELGVDVQRRESPMFSSQTADGGDTSVVGRATSRW